MVGTNPAKMPLIREHFDRNIAQRYKDMDCGFDAYPKGDTRDPEACAFPHDAADDADDEQTEAPSTTCRPSLQSCASASRSWTKLTGGAASLHPTRRIY